MIAAKSGKNRNFSPLHRILLYYPAGQKFTRNRSLTISKIFSMFCFPLKSKMAAKSGENLNFSPLHRTLLYYPAGQKVHSKSLYLIRFLRYSHFFIFCKNPRWPPKVAKIEIFPLCIGYYPVGKKFARNHSISYGFRDIHTFSFSFIIQDGRQKWRKLKFFPFAQGTLVLPCGSKIRSKSLYLLWFSRYSHVFIFR